VCDVVAGKTKGVVGQKAAGRRSCANLYLGGGWQSPGPLSSRRAGSIQAQGRTRHVERSPEVESGTGGKTLGGGRQVGSGAREERWARGTRAPADSRPEDRYCLWARATAGTVGGPGPITKIRPAGFRALQRRRGCAFGPFDGRARRACESEPLRSHDMDPFDVKRWPTVRGKGK